MGTPKKRVVSVIEATSDGSVHENAKNSVSDNQLLLTQLLEDKQTFVYKKLVVPMNMRSVYWKCYGFPANEDGEILTKVKIVCILCKTVISYNGNTSNLRMHLRSKHPQELDDLEAQAPPKKPRAEVKEKKSTKKQKAASPTVQYSMYSADGTVLDKDVHIVSDPNITIEELSSPSTVKVLMKSESPTHNQNVTYLMQESHHTPDELELHVQGDQSNFDRKTISDAIAEFIIMDLQLPDVVETGGFQRLVATLRSPCEIPSKIKLVEDVIPKLYDTFKDSIKENLSSLTGSIAVGIEEWVSDNSQSNVTITAHYQMPKCEEQLQSKVLLTYHCSELYDSELWCHTFDKLLVDWGIKADRVKAIIIATDQQLLLSALRLRGFVLIPCLVYTLQQVCMSCCFTLPIVSNVVNKVRMFLSLVYRNSNALTTLRIQEHVLQLDDVPLTLDYPKIWISTYIMLEQMLARRSIVKSVIEVIDASTYEKELINISDEDWSVVEDIVHVLEPFKVTLMTLAEEKSPLISLLKPLMWQLISVHLKVREDSDSDLSKQLKLALSQMLKDKYSEESVDTILKTATTLDPRFKQLPYAIEEGKTMLSGPIKQQLMALMEEKNVTTSSKDGEVKDTSKKTRLSGMEFLLGDLCTTSAALSINERADLEITQYQSEPMANLDHCPLTWWQKSTSKFPNLARLASSYNCIPATATPPSRIPVEPQVSYDMKRSKIFPEIMDKLLFLNANRQHYV